MKAPAAALLALLPLQAPWTADEMRADLDALARAVRDDWSYYDDRVEHFGLDLDALLERARAEVDGVASKADFARVVRRFVAALGDGHAGLALGTDAPPERRVPLVLDECVEGVVVVAVAAQLRHARGGDAAEPALPARGDLLVALDGRSVAELVAELEREQFGSTPGQRRRNALEALTRVSAEHVTCTLAAPDGAQRDVTLDTLAWGTTLPDPRPGAAGFGLSSPAEGVLLLRIDTFAVPRWKEWLAASVEERDGFLVEARARLDDALAAIVAAQPRAVILDLRGNGGGTDLLGKYLAERLLQGSFLYFRLSAKTDGRWSDPMLFDGEDGHGDHPRWLGPLVALIDAGCFSATDNFLRCLDDLHPDLVTVGRPTGGGTGAPRMVAELAHSGARVTLCTMRVHGPRGGLIEARGTTPDVPVRWTRADWLAGRDPDLAAALALIGGG